MKKSLRTIDPAKVSKSIREANPHLFGSNTNPRELARVMTEAKDLPTLQAATEQKRHGKKRKEMNKTEAEFARMLDAQILRGEVVSYDYEGLTLRWGEKEIQKYTPDFNVVVSSESIDGKPHQFIKFIETKGGHIRAVDMLRFKNARNNWPLFTFEMWQKANGEWRQIV